MRFMAILVILAVTSGVLLDLSRRTQIRRQQVENAKCLAAVDVYLEHAGDLIDEIRACGCSKAIDQMRRLHAAFGRPFGWKDPGLDPDEPRIMDRTDQYHHLPRLDKSLCIFVDDAQGGHPVWRPCVER